jgi:hypothetical protein
MDDDYNIDSLNTRFMDKEDIREGRIPFFSEMAGTGEMLQATPEAMSKSVQGVVGGAVSGTVETARLAERAGRVVAKPAIQGQKNIIQSLGVFANRIGLESIGQVVDTLYGSEQNKTAMEALVEAYNEETVLPDYEEVKTYLQDKGLSFDDQGAELVGDILAPL